ncbi:MAG: nuclear transport factor 2 family protein [Proteobacteria bacterium]|nr:nuclear transport factor 2 family protein [Pseudomonadota bacterium]
MGATTEEKLQRIVDHDAIAENIAIHARGIDRSEPDLIRRAYHADGEVAYGFVEGTANDLAEALGAALDDAPMSLHRPTNVWIEIDGNSAKSECYIFAFVPGEDESGLFQAIYGGRYFDRHEKRDGSWRIAHRTYVLDWNVYWPPTGTADPNFDVSGYVRGAKRDNDPGNRLLAEWSNEMGGTAASGGVNMNDDLIARAEEALAKQEIHALILGQARGTDRGDKALLATLFHPGATINAGVFEGPAEEFCEMIVDFTAAMPAMSHHVSNEWIQVNGDQAVAESYVNAYSKQPEGDSYNDQFTGGRYLDKLEKRGGTWKYVHRTFVMDWQTSQPTTDQGDAGMLADLKTRGGKYPTDPLYGFWNA